MPILPKQEVNSFDNPKTTTVVKSTTALIDAESALFPVHPNSQVRLQHASCYFEDGSGKVVLVNATLALNFYDSGGVFIDSLVTGSTFHDGALATAPPVNQLTFSGDDPHFVPVANMNFPPSGASLGPVGFVSAYTYAIVANTDAVADHATTIEVFGVVEIAQEGVQLI